MDEKELAIKIRDEIRNGGRGRDILKAYNIIEFCRYYFTAKPEGEEWFVAIGPVVDEGDSYRPTSDVASRYKDVMGFNPKWDVVKVYLPKPETKREKLVKEARETAAGLRSNHTTGLASLFEKLADELERDSNAK